MSQITLITICGIVVLLSVIAITEIDKQKKENHYLRIENSTKFTIHESMVIWSEGYKKAYTRINTTKDYHFIDKDKFTADSLIMLRKLEEIYEPIINYATGKN